MAEIKPIETVYNGYRFRSRLEARWAVFFDVAKIRYLYEPEGFELDDGTRYLPDFYLPELDAYVEIKPDTEEGVSEILNKTWRFVYWGGPIKRIIILSNIPETIKDAGIWHFPAIYWNDVASAGWWFFYRGYEDVYGRPNGEEFLVGGISSAHYPKWGWPRESSRKFSIKAKSDFELRGRHYSNDGFDWSRYWFDRNHGHGDGENGLLFDAIDAARQARFEHGEHGR